MFFLGLFVPRNQWQNPVAISGFLRLAHYGAPQARVHPLSNRNRVAKNHNAHQRSFCPLSCYYFGDERVVYL